MNTKWIKNFLSENECSLKQACQAWQLAGSPGESDDMESKSSPMKEQEIAMVFLRWLNRIGNSIISKHGVWKASRNFSESFFLAPNAEALARKLMEEMK